MTPPRLGATVRFRYATRMGQDDIVSRYTHTGVVVRPDSQYKGPRRHIAVRRLSDGAYLTLFRREIIEIIQSAIEL